MDIYARLAPHYDDYFPQDPRATALLLELAGGERVDGKTRRGSPPLVVDFGCATGSQALALAEAGWRAMGFEPCEAMLEIARDKASGLTLPAIFEPWPMLEAVSRLEEGSVDLALCLGNTLPHLEGAGKLKRFVSGVFRILAPGGAAVFQLLNYARLLRLLAAGEYRFPSLRSKASAFERSYALDDEGLPRFHVELEEDGRRFVESSRLSPFTPEDLVSRLSASGFKTIDTLSGWDGASFDASRDPYLILLARP